MEINEAVNDALNDLVMINNDRIAGYENAIGETDTMDIDLRATFKDMAAQSRLYKQELGQLIEKNGGLVEDDTTASGKIYRAWMDIKSTLTGNDRLSVLSSCEFGEDATQRVYDTVLSSGKIRDEETRKLVEDQQNTLKKSLELIKKQHEAYKQLI